MGTVEICIVQQQDCRLEVSIEYYIREMGLTVDHPSETAQKYLQEHVKTMQEEELPIGSHLRCRRILEGLRGHKQSRRDLEESFANYYAQTKGLAKFDVKPATCSGVRSQPGKFNSLQKPGAGIGWTEPRNEAAIGLFDIRKHLKGYIGGVKKRDTMFADV